MYVKNLNHLYVEYVHRYNGNPKHTYSHFIRVMSRIYHHRTLIKPKVKWWNGL
jgi:hypothetical protein